MYVYKYEIRLFIKKKWLESMFQPLYIEMLTERPMCAFVFPFDKGTNNSYS